MGERASVEIRSEPSDSPAAQTLLAGFMRDIESLYEGWTPTIGPTATPEDFAPPAGTFLVGYLDGRPVVCGGLKQLAPDTVEVKRLYVEPELRGGGLARTMLDALENAARDAGYTVIRLDTGRNQPEALHVFETSGYTPIPDYNDNPWAAYWLEKELSPR